MQTIAFRALRAAALLLSVAAAPAAMAGTLTQPFSITVPFNVANPPDGATTALVANSAFDLHMLPFVGSGLSSAVFNFVATAGGTITPGQGGGGTGLMLAGQAALNGIAFRGIGDGAGGGGPGGIAVPFSIGPLSGSRDLMDSFGTSNGFPTLLTGTEVLDFTFFDTLGNPSVFVVDFPQNTAVVAGSMTLSGSLTYTFTGEGALLSTDVPEPASLAVLGIGLAGLAAGRRRRAA